MTYDSDNDGSGLPHGLTDDIAALAAVMQEHGLGKIEVSANGVRVTLSAPRVAKSADAAAAAAAAIAEVVGQQDVTPNGAPHGFFVTSPMIGTYYAQPGPGEAPFVRVGDLIAAGQTVAIIEAMKIMNEIQAERGGVVEELLVSDGQPVEYNQPLIRLA